MIYYTQNIQTGNANAQSSVVSTVNGNNNVSTHIEVEANGDKKVLDSNSSGTYSLSVQSNNDVEASETPTIAISNSPTATPTPKIMQENAPFIKSTIAILLNKLQNLFKQFFSKF